MRVLLAVLLAQAAFAQAFEKLTLEQAEVTAVKNNPLISAAVLDSLAAGQVPVQLRSALYPNAFASVTGAGGTAGRLAAGALSASTIVSRVGAGVGVTQLLTDFGRTTSLVSSSRLHAQSRTENAQATRSLVLLLVDRSYYAALRAQAVLQVAQQTVADRQLIVDRVTELAKNRLKSGLDVSFAGVNLSEAKLLLLSAQNDVQAAFAELSAALGNPRQQISELTPPSVPAPPPDSAAGIAAQALRSRPDIASLRSELESSRKFVTAEKALWFPTISAVGTAGVVPLHQDPLNVNYGAVGVNVNIPIFNGHLFSARRTEADFRAQQAAETLRDLENRITRDVTVAWLNASTAYQRLALSSELLSQANQALELAQARYDIGLSSIIELSQAQLNKTSAEIQSTSAQYDFQTQNAVLNYQTGVLR